MKILRYLQCMSIINPTLCKETGIIVEVEQRGEGPIPHMHVFHDSERNPRKCSYVRLDEASYSAHHKDAVPLPPSVKEKFIIIMKSPWPKHVVETNGELRVATGYEAAVDTWAETYENNDLSKFKIDDSGSLVMPDYSKL